MTNQNSTFIGNLTYQSQQERNNNRFRIIYNQNLSYRVQKILYDHNLHNILINCLICTCITIIAILNMINHIADRYFQPKEDSSKVRWMQTLTIITITSSMIAVLSFARRNIIAPMQLLSHLILAVYLNMLIIFCCVQINYKWMLASSFGLLQLFIAGIYLQSKKKVTIIGVIIFYFILVSLKVDQVIIQVQWIGLLTLPIAFAFFALAGFIITAIQGSQLYSQNPGVRLKSIYTFYQAYQMLSLGLCLGCLSSMVLLLNTTFGLALAVTIHHGAIIPFFAWKFKNEIILYQINAEPLPSQQVRYLVIEKVQEVQVFKKMSSNWLVIKETNIQQLQSSLDQSSQSGIDFNMSLKTEQCSACMSEQLTLVSMPCGHLTVCDNCGKYLRDINKIQCIICKRKCSRIYHLSSSHTNNPKQYRSDYFYRILTLK